MYIEHLVEVFRAVREVLHPTGTLWLNIGDGFARQGGVGAPGKSAKVGMTRSNEQRRNCKPPAGMKSKDLMGIPWLLAFALRDDGWWLRADNIWFKPNPMPSSATDRTTRAHEQVFMFAKSERYFYDHMAERESGGGNKFSVWTINLKPFPGAHFAVFPPKLPETCIKLGTSEGGCCPKCLAPRKRKTDKVIEKRMMLDEEILEERTIDRWVPSCKCDAGEAVPCTVLDPFAGSGTTLAVAKGLGRSHIGIELNAEYISLCEKRVGTDDFDTMALLAGMPEEEPGRLVVGEPVPDHEVGEPI